MSTPAIKIKKPKPPDKHRKTKLQILCTKHNLKLSTVYDRGIYLNRDREVRLTDAQIVATVLKEKNDRKEKLWAFEMARSVKEVNQVAKRFCSLPGVDTIRPRGFLIGRLLGE